MHFHNNFMAYRAKHFMQIIELAKTNWCNTDRLPCFSELQLKQDHKPVEHLNNWTKKIVGMLTDGDPKQEMPQLRWRRNAKIGLSEEKQVLGLHGKGRESSIIMASEDIL